MKKLSFLNYFFVLAIITILFGTIYVTVQQSYRSGANDPQIKNTRDINIKLHEGKSIENFFQDTIDIARSLSSFAAVYDAYGNPIRSSGFLEGKMPQLPPGVFEFTKSHGEHAVTWQPRSGVRMAMVVISSNTSPIGFVASGRSLQEVEVREHNLVTMVFFGWIGCVGLVLLHAVIQFYRNQKN